MAKVVVFAGTTEGRVLTEELQKRQISAVVSAATEYGGSLLKHSTQKRQNNEIRVLCEAKTETEIETLLKTENPRFVIDATHLYAQEVSKNIRMACQNQKLEYVRLLRETEKKEEAEKKTEIKDGIYVDSASEAAEYLTQTKGNIFISTGSKNLKEYCKIPDYQERLFVRVLSVGKSVALCEEVGIRGSHLIAMQGPFSEELNLAMFRSVSAKFLVTKDSGKQGGFSEKLSAAEKAEMTVIIIRKPEEVSGYSLEEVIKKLDLFDEKPEKREKRADIPEIIVCGTGMGNCDTLTIEAMEALKDCHVIFGAKRVLAGLNLLSAEKRVLYKAEEILSGIEENINGIEQGEEWKKIGIAFSGDIGCFSGAKKLLELLHVWKEQRKCSIRIISGIAAPVYFMDRIHQSWEDINLISWHGKRCPILAKVKKYKKNFFFLGASDDAACICGTLETYGFGYTEVTIGEELSYENERIQRGHPAEFLEERTSKLAVMLVENKKAESNIGLCGIPDEQFIREKVPMTKEEVRSICLSKLKLKADSVLYDIGAGTGSVSIEAAQLLEKGIVYAIERKKEAVSLIEKNKKKFAADNLEIVQGMAPEALNDLSKPTHVFIGGSGGNLKEILTAVKKKNPDVKIVMTAISLETVASLLEEIKKLEKIKKREGIGQTKAENWEIIQVGISRAKRLNGYHMMMGQNPVFIISN